MRGIHIIFTLSNGMIGITPAYAGNTPFAAAACSLFQDHPRLCGEYVSGRNFPLLRLGSPPPMRGILRGDSRGGATDRITPAYAGNTISPKAFFTCWEDHPRLCGEYFNQFIAHVLISGSPPPMRGILYIFVYYGG